MARIAAEAADADAGVRAAPCKVQQVVVKAIRPTSSPIHISTVIAGSAYDVAVRYLAALNAVISSSTANVKVRGLECKWRN